MPVRKSPNLAVFFEAKIDRMTSEVREAVADAGAEGASEMRQMISTRGTAKGGRNPSNPGRIDTGDMLNDVKSKSSGSAGSVRAQFGWLGGQQKYYHYQEKGFRHRNGVDVEGMYALVDSFELVTEDLKQKIGAAIRRA